MNTVIIAEPSVRNIAIILEIMGTEGLDCSATCYSSRSYTRSQFVTERVDQSKVACKMIASFQVPNNL